MLEQAPRLVRTAGDDGGAGGAEGVVRRQLPVGVQPGVLLDGGGGFTAVPQRLGQHQTQCGVVRRGVHGALQRLHPVAHQRHRAHRRSSGSAVHV